MNHCTCVYAVNAAGASAADLRNAIDKTVVPVPPAFLLLTQATVASDNAVVAGTQAVRTIVFNFSAAFKRLWPDASDQRDPFWHFLQGELQASVIGPVLPAAPVLS